MTIPWILTVIDTTFCNLRPTAISSDRFPDGMFSPSIYLAGDFSSHHTELRFLIDYHKQFMLLSLSKMCGWNLGVQEGSVSGVILQAGAGSSITSAKCKMVWKSQLNNSATLNSHTHRSRCSQMLPDRLSAKRWAVRCSETTSPVLLNVPEVVEQIQEYPEECMFVFEMLQNQTVRMGTFRSYGKYWPRLKDYSSASRTWSRTLRKWLL